MKKSRAVPLSLVSTLAAAAIASGCGSFGRRQGWQTCVDRTTDYSVDQQNCENERRYAHPYGYVPHYYWYYYPRGYYWGAPGIGMRVPVGGTYMTSPHMTAPMAHTGVSAVRGGFGTSATSHAGS